jgi:hypothetical protein
VADILNDLAFFIELLSPHLPRIFFAPLACVASLFRSIVGVAGGATRTAITRHQVYVALSDAFYKKFFGEVAEILFFGQNSIF